MRLGYLPADLALEIRAGYASGDADPDDDTLYRFRFDPNHKVGLVLFGHVMPALTRTHHERVTDPTRTGQPPRGVDGLLSDGAVENALYVFPQIRWGQEMGFQAVLGWLIAQSDVPIADPFSSFANGGNPVGALGKNPASTQLGHEVDFALAYRGEWADALTWEVRGEHGLFFPGEAFEDASANRPDPVHLGRVRVGLSW